MILPFSKVRFSSKDSSKEKEMFTEKKLCPYVNFDIRYHGFSEFFLQRLESYWMKVISASSPIIYVRIHHHAMMLQYTEAEFDPNMANRGGLKCPFK